MRHENRQFDTRELQLSATRTRPSVVGQTDIGNAEITHTIFGRAKVRIIRKQDKIRRAWLLAALAVTVTAAAAWFGWLAWQQSELLQNSMSPASLPSVSIKPNTLPLSANNQPVAGQESLPQQPLGLKSSRQIAEKPITAQSLTTSKQQTAPLATNNNATKNQTDMQQSPKLPATNPLLAPAAATPSTKPATKKPASVSPPAAPLIKEDTLIPLPAGDNQPIDTGNVQP